MVSASKKLGVVVGLAVLLFTGNVMAQAVTSPGVQSAPVAKTIFDYQKELGLTDKQVTDLKNVMTDFEKKMTGFQQEMLGLRQELANLIQTKADMKAVRKQAEKAMALQVNSICTDVETSRKVEAAMTPAQFKQWKEIQEKSRQEIQEQMKAAQAAAPAKK